MKKARKDAWVLATDIDDTLTGDDEALRQLSGLLEKKRRKGELVLVFVTGRPYCQVLDGWRKGGLPAADAVVCQVGTEIFFPPFTENCRPSEEWNQRLSAGFSRSRALEFIHGIENIRAQPAIFNTSLKVSCWVKRSRSEKQVQVIRNRIEKAGSKGYRVVWSSGRDLDIIPSGAGKANALRFVLGRLELSSKKVIVAGDSGNDADLFASGFRGIVVANAKRELFTWVRDSGSGRIFLSSKNFATGLLEGMRHFNVIQ